MIEVIRIVFDYKEIYMCTFKYKKSRSDGIIIIKKRLFVVIVNSYNNMSKLNFNIIINYRKLQGTKHLL